MEEENKYKGIPEGEDARGENRPEESKPSGSVPPAIPEEIRTEKKWADTLGIDYDEEKAAHDNAAPVPDEMPGLPPQPRERKVPPVYVMSPDEELPPAREEFREPMPPTYMVWAVIATVFCCLPLGVAAIFFAAQVSTKYYARDFDGARKSSERAEIWIIASIVTGVLFNILYLPLWLITGMMAGV